MDPHEGPTRAAGVYIVRINGQIARNAWGRWRTFLTYARALAFYKRETSSWRRRPITKKQFNPFDLNH